MFVHLHTLDNRPGGAVLVPERLAGGARGRGLPQSQASKRRSVQEVWRRLLPHSDPGTIFQIEKAGSKIQILETILRFIFKGTTRFLARLTRGKNLY